MRPEVEVVAASGLSMGDEIWIPNSRKAQAIEQIMKTTANGEETISLVVGDATWVVSPDQEIRRVKAA